MEKSFKPVQKSSDSIAVACHDVSVASGLLVECKYIEAVGVVPRAKLNEKLGRLELGTKRLPILRLPEELELSAANLISVGRNP